MIWEEVHQTRLHAEITNEHFSHLHSKTSWIYALLQTRFAIRTPLSRWIGTTFSFHYISWYDWSSNPMHYTAEAANIHCYHPNTDLKKTNACNVQEILINIWDTFCVLQHCDRGEIKSRAIYRGKPFMPMMFQFFCKVYGLVRAEGLLLEMIGN